MAKRAKKKIKKTLTNQQEFEIMKLVLDKFLWLGFGIMAFGLYEIMVNIDNILKGFWFLGIGTVILIIFLVLILREYEYVK